MNETLKLTRLGPSGCPARVIAEKSAMLDQVAGYRAHAARLAEAGDLVGSEAWSIIADDLADDTAILFGDDTAPDVRGILDASGAVRASARAFAAITGAVHTVTLSAEQLGKAIDATRTILDEPLSIPAIEPPQEAAEPTPYANRRARRKAAALRRRGRAYDPPGMNP